MVLLLTVIASFELQARGRERATTSVIISIMRIVDTGVAIRLSYLSFLLLLLVWLVFFLTQIF